jgi:hypothetical protein
VSEDFAHEPVWEPAGWGDCIEAFFDLGDTASFHQDAAVELAGDHYWGNERQTDPFTREEAKHGHIIYLCGNDGPDAALFEEEIEGDANIAV